MMTVIFATYNGAGTLRRVLEAHTRLQPPDGGWQLVAVDNGSTDTTPSILADFAGRLPLTRLQQPTPGKNHALNLGLGAVSGDLVVFTDDDTVPREDWLQQLRRVADTQPRFDVFGGSVQPGWDTPPPVWLLTCVPLDVTYSLTDPKLPDGPVGPGLIFGPNMAVRAGVFAQGHCFDPSIGPNRHSYAMGSETELTKRLVRRGLACGHFGAAVVEHIIRPHQMRRAWVLRRAIRFGRGQWRTDLAPNAPSAPLLFGVPRYLFGLLIRQVGRALSAHRRGDEGARFREHWELSYLLGVVLEARRHHRRAGPAAVPICEKHGADGDGIRNRR
jgi:glycosyltransferase involved in cell wall biosynthesis